MIEIRELQRKLNQILTRLLGLSVSQRQATLTREDLLMVPVNQDPKEWLTYNVRWAYDNMQRLSEIVDVSTFAPLDEARSFRSIE